MPDSTIIESMPSERLLPLPSVGQKSLIPAKQPTLATSIVTAHLNQTPLDFWQPFLFTDYQSVNMKLFINQRAAELARFNRTLQQQIKQTTHWLKENETIILNGIDAAFIAILSTILIFSACLPGIGPAFQKIATVMTNLWNGVTIATMAGILPTAMQNVTSHLDWLRLTIDFSSTALLLANVSLQIASLAGAVIAPYIQPLTNAISSWCDTISYSISYYQAWKEGKETAAIGASLKKSLCLAVGATLITAGLIIATALSHGTLPIVFLAAKGLIAAAGLFASQALSSSKPAEAKKSIPSTEENIKPAVSSTAETKPATFIKSIYSFFTTKDTTDPKDPTSTIKPIAPSMAA